MPYNPFPARACFTGTVGPKSAISNSMTVFGSITLEYA
jgi:hypothetical protein